MRYVIEHRARLQFAEPVREHHCELRVTPRADDSQRVLDVNLRVEPEASVQSYVDYFGNRVHQCDIIPAHDRLDVSSRAEVDTLLDNPFGFPLMTAAQEWRWLEDTLQQQPRLWDYVLHRSELTPEATHLTADDINPPVYSKTQPFMEAVITARDWVTATFEYRPDERADRSPLSAILKSRAGNAPDLSHLLLIVVRGWGFPARYVNGYRDPDPELALDVVEPHAWAQVLIPGAGWRGFDCAASLVTNQTYIAVAVGRDAHDVPTLRSSTKGTGMVAEPQVSIRLQRQQAQQ